MLERRGKKGIWTTRFIAPGGREVRRSTGTSNKRLAQEFEVKLRAELWRVAKLGDRPRRTWQDAAVEWIDTHADKDTIGKDRANLRWLDPHLGDKFLDEIDEELLRTVAAARRAEPANKRATATPKTPPNKRRKPTGDPDAPMKRTSPATVNRMLALVGSILRAARDDWKWIDRIPTVPKLAEPKRDVPVIPRDLAARVFAEIPAHLRPMFGFALSVGLREQNVLRLRWVDVDMAGKRARIPGSQTKAGEPIAVPLNADALAILEAQAGKSDEWVFPSPRGVPYVRANNTAWRNARARAGVPWLRWHDLRHAWAQWHAQAGTPLLALKDLGAWSNVTMVERYAAFSVDHLSEHAARIATSAARGLADGPREDSAGEDGATGSGGPEMAGQSVARSKPRAGQIRDKSRKGRERRA